MSTVVLYFSSSSVVMLVANYSLKQLKQCCTQTHCPYLHLYFRQKLRLVHNLPPESLSVVHMQSCHSSCTPEVYTVEPAQVRTRPIGLIWLWPTVPAHLSRVARVSVIPKKIIPWKECEGTSVCDYVSEVRRSVNVFFNSTFEMSFK